MDDASYIYLITDRISIIQSLICNSIGTEMHHTYNCKQNLPLIIEWMTNQIIKS
jgi:hypothetical protein